MFIARGEHLRAIRSEGLHVDTPAGEILIHPAQATDDPAQVGEVDVVLLGVKAWQVRDAANAMRPMFGAETFVVPLQNGVEAAAQLAAVLGTGPVLGGLCGTFSWVVGPGRIRNISVSNFVRFGELDNRRSERAERLRAALERAGVKAEVSTDVRKTLWEKFMFITSFGGMGAVTRAPIGIIRALPETRQILEQCVREVDPHPADAGLSARDLRVQSDSFRLFHGTSGKLCDSCYHDHEASGSAANRGDGRAQ